MGMSAHGGGRTTAHLRVAVASASACGARERLSGASRLIRCGARVAVVWLAQFLQTYSYEHVKARSGAVLAISGVLPSGWDETSFREVRFYPATRGVRTWRIPAARRAPAASRARKPAGPKMRRTRAWRRCQTPAPS